jgi:transposase
MAQTQKDQEWKKAGSRRRLTVKQIKALVEVALQDDETTDRLASRFQFYPTMISTWKRQLLDSAADLFDKNHKSRKQVERRFVEFYQEICQLMLENAFLARNLGS